MDMMIDSIREIPFFNGFQYKDLKDILANCRQETYRKGKILFYQSEMTEGTFFLIEGKISRIKYRSDESSISLGDSGPGNWFGLAETICGSMYLYDAAAAESSTVLHFPAVRFHAALRNPVFMKKILEYIGKEHFLLHNQLEMNQPHTRLIKNLLNAVSGKPEGERIVFATQDELADLNGITRETVNKHLNRLQQEGLIQIGRGKIEILKPDELRKLI